MRKHRRATNNGLSREKLPKRAFSPSLSFWEAAAVKTCLIIALYCIFSRHLLSEYPLQIRGIGDGADDSQNESFCRRRLQAHAKPCSATVSSYAEVGWLRPLLLESRGLLQGSPQALSAVRRYQVRAVVRILVPQDEWNITLISAQKQKSRGGKIIITLGRYPNASIAFATLLSHRETLFAGEHMPCGNDGIDAHVEKRWRTLAVLHSPFEAQIGSAPFSHNRFENSFVRNPCRRRSLKFPPLC